MRVASKARVGSARGFVRLMSGYTALKLQCVNTVAVPPRNAYSRAMTVELTPSQEALIREQLATERYHSRAEVITEALELLSDHARLEQMKLERLRAEIQKGLEGGSTPLDMQALKVHFRKLQKT